MELSVQLQTDAIPFPRTTDDLWRSWYQLGPGYLVRAYHVTRWPAVVPSDNK